MFCTTPAKPSLLPLQNFSNRSTIRGPSVSALMSWSSIPFTAERRTTFTRNWPAVGKVRTFQPCSSPHASCLPASQPKLLPIVSLATCAGSSGRRRIVPAIEKAEQGRWEQRFQPPALFDLEHTVSSVSFEKNGVEVLDTMHWSLIILRTIEFEALWPHRTV